METLTSSELSLIEAYCFFYWFLVMFGIILVALRDDRLVIYNDFKRGINKGFALAFLHIVLLILIMPITIPFSIGRIIKKWF